MTRYAQNGGLTRFDTGGSHSKNPNGGIDIGNNNSVEENETKQNNFVYSNRIFLDSNIVSQYNLPKSLVGKSVADATKFIDNKFKGRNDKISQSTKDAMLSKIAEAQESMKPQEPEMEQQGYSENIESQNQLAFGGNPTISTTDSDTIVQPEIANDNLKYGSIAASLSTPIGNAVYNNGDQQRSNNIQSVNSVGNALGSSIGGNAGGIVGNAVTGTTGLYEMGSEVFGKSNVETSGQRSVSGANAGKSAGAGALKGAGTGAAIGSIIPGVGTVIGAGVGALVGGVTGFIGGKKDEKAQAKNNARYASNFNKQFSDQYAFGGEIDPTQSKQMSARDIESAKQMSNYRTLRDSAISRYPTSEYTPDLRTPEQAMMDYQYLRDSVKPNFKVNSGYMPNLTSPEEAQRLYNKSRGIKLAYGGPVDGTINNDELTSQLAKQYLDKTGDYYKNLKLTPRNTAPIEPLGLKPVGTTVPYTIGTQPTVDISNANRIATPGPSNLDVLKYNTNKVGNYINDNAGNIARYAPIVANAYQLAKLKKPQGERLARLDNRYKPSYVDMAQQQNIVNQELNNTNSAIQASGASQGAIRNAILGAQLNKTKALSNAYMNAEAQNRQQDAIAQQFNLGVDQTNLQQSNTEKDINARDQAAYRNEKSKYISAIGSDIGEVGKEQVQKKMISTATGYTYDGKYVKSPDGNIVTDPDTGEPMTGEKMKTLQSNKNVKKQALGGYLIKNKIQ